MNTQNNHLFTTISKTETKNMTSVVNETVSSGSKQGNSFTAADLWNIQRNGRSIQQRKHFS